MRRLALLLCLAACTSHHVEPCWGLDHDGGNFYRVPVAPMVPGDWSRCPIRGEMPDGIWCWERPEAFPMWVNPLPDAGTIPVLCSQPTSIWKDARANEDGTWGCTGPTGATGPGASCPPGAIFEGPISRPPDGDWDTPMDRGTWPASFLARSEPRLPADLSRASTASICVYGRHADGGCLDDSHDTRWCCRFCRRECHPMDVARCGAGGGEDLEGCVSCECKDR